MPAAEAYQQAPPVGQTAWPAPLLRHPKMGQPLPRAHDAYATAKWRDWILAAHGHGPEWARVFDI